MWEDNFNNCDEYPIRAEWLYLSVFVNEWCGDNQECKELKRSAILDACDSGEIEYTRNGGKSFNGSALDLYSTGLLLINKKSFYKWKSSFINKSLTVDINNSENKPKNLYDFLKSVDEEYISVKDALNFIHNHIGLDKSFEEAAAILSLAIGQQIEPPRIYKKEKTQGWLPVISDSNLSKFFYEAPNPSTQRKLNTINYAIQQEINEFNDDDLPF